MIKAPESYNQCMDRLYSGDTGKIIKEFTFQVTEDCPLRCTYCYQPVKLKHYMDFETAKKAVDLLFSQALDPDFMFSYEKTLGVVFEFIGGEPLLAIDVIKQIIDYIEFKLLSLNSPWLYFHKYSFSSNGVLYFDQKFQELIRTHGDLISVAITVDGNKELHDSCRVFPDGSGSYDLAIKAALDQKERFGNTATKITIAPDNVDKLSGAVLNMFNLGFTYVFANCCFEEGWELKHATIFYYELKKIADFILKNRYEEIYGTSLFNEDFFIPYSESVDDDTNWCGGTGQMLSMDYQGKFYPCIRYMPNSLLDERPPLTVGTIDTGIYKTQEDKNTLDSLLSITRTSQSPDKCNVCRVARGCAWCSGYNYQKFGTANKRATYICEMHKARALANLYFWSLYSKISSVPIKFKNYLTDEIALSIIAIDEWTMLKKLWEDVTNG